MWLDGDVARGNRLPAEHHVARHCGPATVGKDGLPTVAAFEPKPDADHLSVNWLEYYQPDDKDDSVAQIRQGFLDREYELKLDGRFAVLNVDKARHQVKIGAGIDIRILHWPENSNESHSGIFDYTSENLQVALDLKSIVTAGDVYPALA